jgi:predicted kinase
MKARHRVLILLSCLTTSTIGQSSLSFASIIHEHMQLLGNLDKVNPPLMLLFSATPGMGKTTIATKIQDALGAVKITVDDGRKLLIKHAIPIKGDIPYLSLSIEEKIAYIVEYLDQLINEIGRISANKFIIIDDSVNQWYDQIKSIADKHAMPTFLIRLTVSKATAIERIKQRERHPQGYLDAMDRWFHFYEKLDEHLFDYVFCNEYAFDDKQFQELLSLLK